MNLCELYDSLIKAGQEKYDKMIDNGLHPYAVASYHFTATLQKELETHVGPTTDWGSDDWEKLWEGIGNSKFHGMDEYDMGAWATGAFITSRQAWATPGFAAAYVNSCKS